MSLKFMSKDKEAQIASAVEKSAELVADGLSPNDAIIKVAKDSGFNDNVGRLMVNAYNVSRTLANFETEKGEKRASEFPVADAEIVAKALVDQAPTKRAGASIAQLNGSTNYLELEPDVASFEEKYITKKVASNDDGSPDYILMERLLREKHAAEQMVEGLRSAKGQLEVRFSEKLYGLADTVRKQANFAKFEADAVGLYGSPAQTICDSIYEAANLAQLGEKRASASSSYIDDTKPNMVAVGELIKLSQDYVKAAGELDNSAGALLSFKEIGSAASDLTGSALNFLKNDIVNPYVESKSKLKPRTFNELNLPVDLKNEFENARVSTVLSDILADDEVLSQEDPSEVARIAQQQLEINPQLISKPAVLASAVRRALASRGDIDLFTAKQLVDITRPNDNRGSDAQAK